MTETEYFKTKNRTKVKAALDILGSLMWFEEYGIPEKNELPEVFRILDKLHEELRVEIDPED